MSQLPTATEHAAWVIDLSGTGWVLQCLDGDEAPRTLPPAIPATVPGCVHTDLLAAGLLDDPYLDTAEDDQHWIGHARWVYRRDLELPAAEDADAARRVELVCDGLDTVATVRLNGIEVGATANMHRRYRFDLEPAAHPGTNELEIEFGSAWAYAEALEGERGRLPHAYTAPFDYIRKMACNFGWDWGPTVVTAGIWRPIRVEIGPTARLGDLRVAATWTERGAHLRLRPEHAGEHELRVRVTGPGIEAVELSGTGSVDADLPGAHAWWPHSLGDQPLYRIEAELLVDGEAVDHAEARTGFRTITLDASPDTVGRRFALAVNGQELYVRGANWIPDDCFPTRIDAARYAERVGQATAAGIDLLRAWGGGLYEDDAFYAACDEAGVLVWQDFLFACAAYPEEEPIRSEVLAEAADNVSRLMPHPSLALWNGNNENLWGHEDWGWRDQLGDRTWGRGYYLDLLPAVVAEIDGTRPYWPGSPWSGDPDVHPNAMTHGCSHIWDVWNTEDYTVYATHDPRFAAEFGFQGPPTWATLTQAIHDDPLMPRSPGMLAHQKAEDGQGKLDRGLAGHLPVPDDLTDWHFATQVNQARAVAYGIRHHRSLRGHCMGSIVWQLNDCWPVTSWAALDSGRRADGSHVARRRPLWYALREVFADRLIIADQGGGVVLVNDGIEPWSGTLTTRMHTVAEPGGVEHGGFDTVSPSGSPGSTSDAPPNAGRASGALAERRSRPASGFDTVSPSGSPGSTSGALAERQSRPTSGFDTVSPGSSNEAPPNAGRASGALAERQSRPTSGFDTVSPGSTSEAPPNAGRASGALAERRSRPTSGIDTVSPGSSNEAPPNAGRASGALAERRSRPASGFDTVSPSGSPGSTGVEAIAFEVAPRSRSVLPDWIMVGGSVACELVASTGERQVVLGAEDVDLPLPVARLDGTVTRTAPSRVEVTVTAHTFLRSLCLFADRVHPDAEADTMLVDLFPGQSHTFVIDGSAGFADGVPDDTWLGAPVLRCVNQLINQTTQPHRRTS